MSATREGPRGIPTSRAYWELQAEKLLNRVFEPATAIDLEPLSDDPIAPAAASQAPAQLPEAAATPPATEPSNPAANRQRRARRPGSTAPAPGFRTAAPPPSPQPHPASGPAPVARPAWAQPLLLVAVFAGAGLVTATSGVLALSQWNRYQEALQQERNLLLVERLRSFGPAVQPAPTTPPAPTLTPPSSTASTNSPSGGPNDGGALPPPPPNEAWIEELATLPQPSQRPATLLRVPVSAALGAAAAPSQASPAPRHRAPAGPVPLLVGVVAVPGKPGSAIFQMGGSTTTVAVGEGIGGSGWRLIASDGDSVEIENQGEVRHLSIGSGG